MYATLSKRRARVLREEMREGSDLFSIHAYLPAQVSRHLCLAWLLESASTFLLNSLLAQSPSSLQQSQPAGTGKYPFWCHLHFRHAANCYLHCVPDITWLHVLPTSHAQQYLPTFAA